MRHHDAASQRAPQLCHSKTCTLGRSPFLLSGSELLRHCGAASKSESASRGRCCCGTQPNWRLFFWLMVPPDEDLRNVLRALDGMADAASWGAILSVMMKLYPDKVATIMSSNEMIFGLGYALGPVIGGSLYDLGGFKFPFITIGSICLVNTVSLAYYIPGLS